MYKFILKIIVIFGVLLMNTSCKYSEDHFIDDRDKCIFVIDEKRNELIQYDFGLKYNAINKTENPKEIILESIDNVNKELEDKAFEIANKLIGLPGSCIYIADLFLTMFFNETTYCEESIKVDKPRPGDVLYYSDGGLGIEHWGIYINDNYSLQGNYNGTSIIMNGYLIKDGSIPEYRRIYK